MYTYARLDFLAWKMIRMYYTWRPWWDILSWFGVNIWDRKSHTFGLITYPIIHFLSVLRACAVYELAASWEWSMCCNIADDGTYQNRLRWIWLFGYYQHDSDDDDDDGVRDRLPRHSHRWLRSAWLFAGHVFNYLIWVDDREEQRGEDAILAGDMRRVDT